MSIHPSTIFISDYIHFNCPACKNSTKAKILFFKEKEFMRCLLCNKYFVWRVNQGMKKATKKETTNLIIQELGED